MSDPTGLDAAAPALLLVVGQGAGVADPTGLDAGAPAILLTVPALYLMPYNATRAAAQGGAGACVASPAAALPETGTPAILPVAAAAAVGGLIALRRRASPN